MNALSAACKTSVEAYNNQIDAAATAKQYSAAAQQAVADADVTPILRRLKMLSPCAPALFLDFLNNEYYAYQAPQGVVRKTLAELGTSGRASGTMYNGPFGLATAAANTLAIEHDDKGASMGLLCNPASINIIRHSNDFSQSGNWSNANVSLGAQKTVAGRLFTRIVPDSTFITHIVRQTVTTTSGSAYAGSWTIIPDEVFIFRVRIRTSNNVYSGIINLQTMVIPAGMKVRKLKGGAYKLTFSGVMDATLASLEVFAYAADGSMEWSGDGIKGFWLFNGQLEVGYESTSDLITDASTLSRLADASALDITPYVPAVKDISLYIEWQHFSYREDIAPIYMLLRLADAADSANRGIGIKLDGSTLAAEVRLDADPAVSALTLFSSALRTGVNRAVMTLSNSGVVTLTLNGGLTVTSSGATAAIGNFMQRLYLQGLTTTGGSGSRTFVFHGVKRVAALLPLALTAAESQRLTA